MGKEKAGPLTPKGISNRIKAKGLQKLRWYCQMCQKQCRDENGFKCHTMSESHQRQLLLLAEDVDKYMDSFSRELQDAFLRLLKRQFGTCKSPWKSGLSRLHQWHAPYTYECNTGEFKSNTLLLIIINKNMHPPSFPFPMDCTCVS